MHRRSFLKLMMATAAAFVSYRPALTLAAPAPDASVGKLDLTDDEWRKKLEPEQYDVLRHEGTERPFTSPLLNEHRAGMFACAGCDLPLFPSKFKFESGTGWPSFFDSLPGHLQTKSDYSLLMRRTEYHCARCGGHHGHIFNDGPAPTGLRYCNNGVVLTFTADKA